MVDLPYDIWEVVSRHLQTAELLKLAAVHRAFYGMALDIRYGEVWWVKLDKSMVSMLSRLQDPNIARRVRRLHIRAWFIEFLLKQENALESPNQGLGVIGWVSTLFGLTLAKGAPEKQPPHHHIHDISLAKRSGAMSTPGEVMRAMVEAVSWMANVMEYDFEWGDLPLNKDTRLLLTTADTTFGTCLRKLVLSARTSKLAALLTIVKFERLEELEFNFEYDPLHSNNGSFSDSSTTAVMNRELLAKFVAPFINNVGPSLRSLTISSSALGDHSQFFHTLSFLPALRILAIRMPFDSQHLFDSSGLFRVLHTQMPMLRALELRPSRLDKDKPTNSILGQIRRHLLDITQHGNIESLAIPSLDQQMTLVLIRRTFGSLTNLCLSGRFLSVSEVSEMVDVFATASRVPQLTRLSLEVQTMTPHLLAILANGLPGLDSLTLIIDEEYGRRAIGSSSEIAEFQPYIDWKLSSIAIYLKTQRPDTVHVIPFTRQEEEMMTQLWVLIPSIRWFKGREVNRITIL